MKKQLGLVILLVLFRNLSAQTAKDAFNIAVAEYIKGDRQESITLMEKALSLDSQNIEMKEFL